MTDDSRLANAFERFFYFSKSGIEATEVLSDDSSKSDKGSEDGDKEIGRQAHRGSLRSTVRANLPRAAVGR